MDRSDSRFFRKRCDRAHTDQVAVAVARRPPPPDRPRQQAISDPVAQGARRDAGHPLQVTKQ